ncbi:MAG: glutamate racemase, partial [Lactococcus lactis]|nr:glutamate racemase [Lactococcus lactis]
KIDTLILGCTHYPLLRSLIQETMGKEVRLIDSGAEAVRDISVLLNYFGINAHERKEYQHCFYTTAGVNSFREIAEKWLNIGHLHIEHAEIENFNKEK